MNKDNKKFDVDFSGLVSGEKLPIESKEKTKQPTASILSGILLPIPTDKPNQFLSKDLVKCTAEEFYKWFVSVYPTQLTSAEIEVFKTHPSSKLATFKKIVNFHQKFFISVTGEQKKSPIA